MQSPRLGMTSTSHTARATMRMAPVKRVSVVLETIAPPVLLLSVSDRFMYLSLTKEKNTSTTHREVSAILSHSIPYLRLVSVTANVANCWASISLRGDLIFLPIVLTHHLARCDPF